MSSIHKLGCCEFSEICIILDSLLFVFMLSDLVTFMHVLIFAYCYAYIIIYAYITTAGFAESGIPSVRFISLMPRH